MSLAIEHNFSQDELSQLAKSIMQIFNGWGIDAPDQARLMGMSDDTKPRSLIKFSKGTPFPADSDLLLRSKYLLSIHKSLQLVFPHNPTLADYWITTVNDFLGAVTPLAIMLADGVLGMERVACYLDNTGDGY